MRTKLIMGAAALIAVFGGLVFAGCGTPPDDESTTLSSSVSTTMPGTVATGEAAGRWEGEGVSLAWPAGWKPFAAEEKMRWPLGRLLDCTLLFGLEQGDSYPRVELVNLELPPGETLQGAFGEAYETLEAEWGDSLRDVTGWTTSVDGLPALVKSYELPSGEPYYKHQDVWVESDGSLFVLAGRGGVWTFDEKVLPDLEAITQSLRLGAPE
jgi:hypothetical protein